MCPVAMPSSGDVQEVSLQHLQLEWALGSYPAAARTEPDDTVTALSGRPHDERLHAVEVNCPPGHSLREVEPLGIMILSSSGVPVLACGTIPVPTVFPTSSAMALLAYGLLRQQIRDGSETDEDAPISVFASRRQLPIRPCGAPISRRRKRTSQ